MKSRIYLYDTGGKLIELKKQLKNQASGRAGTREAHGTSAAGAVGISPWVLLYGDSVPVSPKLCISVQD